MKIIFTREFTDDEGNLHKPGEVREVPDVIGKRLIHDAVAQERREKRGPEETKDGGEYPPADEGGEDETT